MTIIALRAIHEAAPSMHNLEFVATPFLAKENIFANNRRNHFLWRKREIVFSVSLFLREEAAIFSQILVNFTWKMDSGEILQMNRLLEVESLSFKLQLEDAVSNLVYFDLFTDSTPLTLQTKQTTTS